MTATEEIKQRADIVETIGQYTKLTKAGKNFRGLCPFHSENHPSFFVYPERQSWHCFGACNTGGDVFAFVMKKEGIGFGEALRLLAERYGVTLTSRPEAEAERKERERLFQANGAAADYFHELLLKSPAAEKAREYLAKRGISEKSIALFKLGYSLNSWDAMTKHLTENGYSAGELARAGLTAQSESKQHHDRFRNKLMFPIFDARGHLTGFGARVLDDSLPKYVNSPQTPVFDKSASLYGINLAQEAIRQKERAVIVEGYMDVITAHQYGFNNVIAPMGISLTEKHAGVLKKLSKNTFLALDADSAGGEAMLRGIGYENMLEAEVRVMLLPPGKDPDEVIKEDAALWEKIAGEAVPVTDYAFRLAAGGLDLAKARDKSALAEKLLPVVAGIRDPVRRSHYLQELARLVGSKEATLENALRDLDKKKRQPAAAQAKTTASPKRVVSSQLEEYTLALLLQHPELRQYAAEIPPEHFGSSENHAIFLAYTAAEDVQSITQTIDPSLLDYLESLVSRRLPPGSPEDRMKSCILRLREENLRDLEKKKEALLLLEAETKGAEAGLVKLQEQGIDSSRQLGEIFKQRGGKKGGKA